MPVLTPAGPAGAPRPQTFFLVFQVASLAALNTLNPGIPASSLYLMSPDGATIDMTITSKIPGNRVTGIAFDPAYDTPTGVATTNKLDGLGVKCFSENV
jgi:hypothetical protein